ncbi:hypothetical protein H6F77_13070 [Microcoleus sp. FACHB-831]|uniref:hypothetical protein n=1 Tax=Microcoleus sp. FACHB-831 TaxID=2692827 RepID=UPI00168868A9|nr:hypothetical protein [Microcoleus sp. FACHB-831]MBD1922015.1 hypothetical protein [Microcoleus sp. FACHB-831]
MKPELQRIETTLHQLSQANSDAEQQTPEAVSTEDSARWRPEVPESPPSFSLTVQTFPDRKPPGGKAPTLPKLKTPSFTNHRNAPNPALAMTLLQEIEVIVAGWQQELQQVVRQIQDVYLEGPIVDGWLESHTQKPEAGGEKLSVAEVDRLMDYIDASFNSEDVKVTYQSPRAGYRLCGLDEDGQFWFRPCPPEQVPTVSVAIARYQKLRLLLSRKQDLETRLTQLAETLVVLHSHLNA